MEPLLTFSNHAIEGRSTLLEVRARERQFAVTMRVPLKLLSNLAEVRDEVVEEWLLANHP
jgi:hypothetical protein